MTDDLYMKYLAVSLFRKTAESAAPLAKLLRAQSDEQAVELAAEVFGAVARAGADTTGEWLTGLVECDENPFSMAAAKGGRISERIAKQAEDELLTFKRLSLVKPGRAEGYAPRFGTGGFDVSYGRLKAFYAENGCGALAGGSAFTYSRGEFIPAATGALRLSDLKSYDEEKSEIVRNTENFINGRPAFHALLYGDRGTGKSTTVRTLANEYKGRLKLIELPCDSLCELPALRRRLEGLAQKYIIFIDDLTFAEDDGNADGFKAALEGSLDSGTADNTLIYCTSNRRHLFKETDKTDARHRSDEVQAELALFDRFGLVITFVAPGKDEFIGILKQILVSRGMKWREEYASVAELAALKKGGRTPRAAKQIADLIETTYAELR